MSRTILSLVSLAVTLALAPACDAPEGDDFGAGAVAQRDGGGNGAGGGGILLNTGAMGDALVDGLDIKGKPYNGLALKAVYMWRSVGGVWQYVKADAVHVENGQILGILNGVYHGGAALVDSRWEIEVQKPGQPVSTRTMFIEKYDFDKGGDGLHRYRFAYPDDPSYGVNPLTPEVVHTDNGRVAVCVPDPVDGIESVVYENLQVDMKTGDMATRLDTMNIACLSGGVGKAATWKFRPNGTHGVGLVGFQAAVRALRADFCGDGRSYTTLGETVSVQDAWGRHAHADMKLPDEAFFTAKGAACVTQPRYEVFKADDVDCGGTTPPVCDDKMNLANVPGALLWTKAPAAAAK